MKHFKEESFEQLREKLGHNAVMMQLPIGLESEFEGVVDLVTMQALYFEGESGEHIVEREIPEVGEGIIEIQSLAREAGYRSKVAVSCYDTKIDCVGACVGVRGSRIKNVVDELAGERIDIVRWNSARSMVLARTLLPSRSRISHFSRAPIHGSGG